MPRTPTSWSAADATCEAVGEPDVTAIFAKPAIVPGVGYNFTRSAENCTSWRMSKITTVDSFCYPKPVEGTTSVMKFCSRPSTSSG